MSQDEAALHTRDLDNLTKRNQQLYDQYIRIDIECNRAQQELSEANSRVEQLRNENANLRAEKKIWEVCLFAVFTRNTMLSMVILSLSKFAWCRRTRPFPWNDLTWLILWPMCRGCMATLNDQEKMTAGVWRTRFRRWMTRRAYLDVPS